MSTPKRPKNALSHGVYSSDIVLPWENEKQFNDLHQALREEYYPEGVSEELAVLELAGLHWKRRRLNIGTQLAFRGQPDANALAEAAAGDGWEGVGRYLKKGAGDGDRVCDAARALAKSHTAVLTSIMDQVKQPIGDESKQKDLEKLAVLAKEINAIGQDIIVPMLRLTETYDVDQKIAERAYRPDLMEKELKILAQIDRQIAKTIDNLIRPRNTRSFTYAKQSRRRPWGGAVSLPNRFQVPRRTWLKMIARDRRSELGSQVYRHRKSIRSTGSSRKVFGKIAIIHFSSMNRWRSRLERDSKIHSHFQNTGLRMPSNNKSAS